MNPSSALVRAVVVASAVSLDPVADSGAPPSVKHGFGLPSLHRALYVKAAGGSSRIAVVDTGASSTGIRHGGFDVYTASCSGGKVQVALAWNDLPGHPSATLQLVNDLDLLVWSQAQHASTPTLFYGNGGSVADARNNLEAVSAWCAAGSNVTVAVHGAIVLSPLQSYALVVSGSITQSTFAATNASQTIAQAAAAGRSVQVPHLCSVVAPALPHSPHHRALDRAPSPPVHRALLRVTAAGLHLPTSLSRIRTGRPAVPAPASAYRLLLQACCAFQY
jgi:hypothetical protein